MILTLHMEEMAQDGRLVPSDKMAAFRVGVCRLVTGGSRVKPHTLNAKQPVFTSFPSHREQRQNR